MSVWVQENSELWSKKVQLIDPSTSNKIDEMLMHKTARGWMAQVSRCTIPRIASNVKPTPEEAMDSLAGKMLGRFAAMIARVEVNLDLGADANDTEEEEGDIVAATPATPTPVQQYRYDFDDSKVERQVEWYDMGDHVYGKFIDHKTGDALEMSIRNELGKCICETFHRSKKLVPLKSVAPYNWSLLAFQKACDQARTAWGMGWLHASEISLAPPWGVSNDVHAFSAGGIDYTLQVERVHQVGAPLDERYIATLYTSDPNTSPIVESAKHKVEAVRHAIACAPRHVRDWAVEHAPYWVA